MAPSARKRSSSGTAKAAELVENKCVLQLQKDLTVLKRELEAGELKGKLEHEDPPSSQPKLQPSLN